MFVSNAVGMCCVQTMKCEGILLNQIFGYSILSIGCLAALYELYVPNNKSQRVEGFKCNVAMTKLNSLIYKRSN